jgi:hypothetical protein
VRRARIAAIAVLLATQGEMGCASLGLQRFGAPSADGALPTTVATARALALQNQFDAADSTLAQFAERYPGTPEAVETAYWRALFKMDPGNSRGSVPAAISMLDAYLAEARSREHVVEATSLRRVAGQLDGLSRLAANAMTQAKDASGVAASARAQAADANARADAAKGEPPSAESEIKRLKDELAKANAELERIRKRLSTPPGKPR